jgi:hypothetical protein
MSWSRGATRVVENPADAEDFAPLIERADRRQAEQRQGLEDMERLASEFAEATEWAADLQRRTADCKAAMEAAEQQQSEVVRRAAAQLFLARATSTDREIGVLRSPAGNLPAGHGKTQEVARLLDSALSDDGLKLLTAWDGLTAARRAKVLEFVEDQRRLSIQEEIDQVLREAEGGGDDDRSAT